MKGMNGMKALRSAWRSRSAKATAASSVLLGLFVGVLSVLTVTESMGHDGQRVTGHLVAIPASSPDSSQAAAFRSGCVERGGTVGATYRVMSPFRGPTDPSGPPSGPDERILICLVSYPGATDQRVAVDSWGRFDAAAADAELDECGASAEDAAAAAGDGHAWVKLPQYHQDSGVCERGTP